MLTILAASAFLQASAARLPEGWDGEVLLALVDADMAATAYANGKLFPIADQRDRIVRVDSSGLREVFVSSTVMAWPGSMAVSADGRHVYVVTSRDEVDRSIEAIDGNFFENMPTARTLQVVDAASMKVVSSTEICEQPRSVDLSPSQDWLLIGCVDEGRELMVLEVDGSEVGDSRTFSVPLRSYDGRPMDRGVTFAAIEPEGRRAAAVLGNRDVARIDFDLADGVPVAATVRDNITYRGLGWLSVVRWDRAGARALVTDVAWGPRPTDAAFNGPGSLLSLDMTGGALSISTAQVSKSPEAFALNRAGDLAVTVNMERTYLPGGWLSLFPGRKASSLSLVSVTEDGVETLGKPLKFRGVLPEAAVFDADGDRVAVAVFQDHGEMRSDGWIAFFAVEGEGDARTLRELDHRIMLSRGIHDLAAID